MSKDYQGEKRRTTTTKLTGSPESTIQNSRLVVCITGMPGAGKSTAAEVSRGLGFEVYRMGDDVRAEAERRRVLPTDENLGAIMIQLRQSGGPAAIAHLCSQRIERESKSRYVLIDGIRNINEFFEFRKLGKAVLVSIHASPEKRFRLLQSRGRSDSPNSFESFEARDRRELSIGIGEAIALADKVIVNQASVEDLKDQVLKLLKGEKLDYDDVAYTLGKMKMVSSREPAT